ncbi:MAG: hypothetical protein CMJ18_26685 [Phycisphaeraceae bacterium]|nr:hypothetical protein [Phycisphaeraceae bacterium]
MQLSLSGFLYERRYQSCDLDFAEFVDLACRKGFEAVELRRTQIGVDTPLADVATMRRIVDEAGLFVSCMEARGMPGEDPDRTAFFKALIERAAVMGSRLIKFPGMTGADFTWHRWAADLAASHEIALATNNHVGTIFETAEGSLDALRRFGHDNYGVLYDCLHLRFGGSDHVKAIDALAPWIRNVLIHGGRPNDSGDDPPFIETTIDDPRSQNWQAVFSALRRVGYDGLITVIEHTEDGSLRERIVSTYPALLRAWWEQWKNHG